MSHYTGPELRPTPAQQGVYHAPHQGFCTHSKLVGEQESRAVPHTLFNRAFTMHPTGALMVTLNSLANKEFRADPHTLLNGAFIMHPTGVRAVPHSPLNRAFIMLPTGVRAVPHSTLKTATHHECTGRCLCTAQQWDPVMNHFIHVNFLFAVVSSVLSMFKMSML